MPSLRLQTRLVQSQLMELALSIKPSVAAHWDKKILEGIIPTEIKNQGSVSRLKHLVEMERIATFVGETVDDLFEGGEWETDSTDPIETLHYFGIGTGEDLRKVTTIANRNRHAVAAYDTSSIAVENGQEVFLEAREECSPEITNEVFLADMEFACQEKFISKPKGKAKTKLVAVRVLDVLTTQEKNWLRKPAHQRKMARTATGLGKLLPYTDVLLIHPCPEDNPNAIWGDSIPESVSEVVKYMKEGCGEEVLVKERGTCLFYTHIYRAVLFQSMSEL